MKFPNFSLSLFHKSAEDFNTIVGYDDIKDIVRRALDSEENYNLLFIGPPASAKTLFLLGILELIGNTRAQTWGIFRWLLLDVLEQDMHVEMPYRTSFERVT